MSGDPAHSQEDPQGVLGELSRSDGSSSHGEVNDAYLEDALRNVLLRKHNRERQRLNARNLDTLNLETLANNALGRAYLTLSTGGKTDRQIVGVFCEKIAELIAEAWLLEAEGDSEQPQRKEAELRARALKYLLLHFLPFERPLEIAFETAPEFSEYVRAGFTLRKSGPTRGPVFAAATSDDRMWREIIASCPNSARRRASDLGWKRSLQSRFELSDEGDQFGRNKRFWKSPQFWDLVRSILALLKDMLG